MFAEIIVATVLSLATFLAITESTALFFNAPLTLDKELLPGKIFLINAPATPAPAPAPGNAASAITPIVASNATLPINPLLDDRNDLPAKVMMSTIFYFSG